MFVRSTLTIGLALGSVGLILVTGCAPESTSKPTAGTATTSKIGPLAYVTNGVASFWVVAEKGAKKAGADLGVKVEVRMPPEGVTDQKRMVQDLLVQGVSGIAISPIDPDNQSDLLEEIARSTILITHDSDAPKSPRLAYIGMDNYTAGRMCGQLVKEAMPDGGSVMLFVGRLGQLNARLRRQGVIDELLGNSPDPERYSPPGEVLKGDKYTILDTRTDEFDFGKAKSGAQDAISKYTDLGCMVGLFAYNPPKCLEAIREAGKTGQIKVVGFDEEDGTLQGIIDGEVYGTVVQNPYEYGYQSIKLLKQLAEGDKSGIPPTGFIDIPAQQIRKETAQAFWDQLKERTK